MKRLLKELSITDSAQDDPRLYVSALWWAEQRIHTEIPMHIAETAGKTFRLAMLQSAFGLSPEIDDPEELQELLREKHAEGHVAGVISSEDTTEIVGALALTFWRFGWQCHQELGGKL